MNSSIEMVSNFYMGGFRVPHSAKTKFYIAWNPLILVPTLNLPINDNFNISGYELQNPSIKLQI